MISVSELVSQIKSGDFKGLARALTIVENDLDGSDELMKSLPGSETRVIGITGPPGAGKSTLVNALINIWSSEEKRIAVIAVDPTSPFNFGSLLGDRVRMSEQFNKKNVYIRSIATRGSLGGLSGKTIEMTDILKSAGFNYIIVETVGVGQSEVEIAGLADTSVVVLVPESGDEIQHIKSGLMEIADIFVVNKADRDGAGTFANNLSKLIHQKAEPVSVIKTVASRAEGIEELISAIESHTATSKQQRIHLIAEKAWKLIQQKRMRSVDRVILQKQLAERLEEPTFNLYRFIETSYPV